MLMKNGHEFTRYCTVALMAVLTRSLGLCGWLQRCLCFLMYCSSDDADGADDDSDADGAALNP